MKLKDIFKQQKPETVEIKLGQQLCNSRVNETYIFAQISNQTFAFVGFNGNRFRNPAILYDLDGTTPFHGKKVFSAKEFEKIAGDLKFWFYPDQEPFIKYTNREKIGIGSKFSYGGEVFIIAKITNSNHYIMLIDDKNQVYLDLTYVEDINDIKEPEIETFLKQHNINPNLVDFII